MKIIATPQHSPPPLLASQAGSGRIPPMRRGAPDWGQHLVNGSAYTVLLMLTFDVPHSCSVCTTRQVPKFSCACATVRWCRFHVAKKSIPSIGGSVKGIKLEQFIFDVFPLASHVALFEASVPFSINRCSLREQCAVVLLAHSSIQ